MQLETADIDPATLNDTSTGFRAAIYQDGKGDYVLAFKNTSGLIDWKADAAQYDTETACSVEVACSFIDISYPRWAMLQSSVTPAPMPYQRGCHEH